MIIELYSKRLKKNEKSDDIYYYDDIPEKLRNQIVHILNSAIGTDSRCWEGIQKIMMEELGVLSLVGYHSSSEYECIEFLKTHKVCEEVLDIIELSFRFIDRFIRQMPSENRLYNRTRNPDEAIEDLNYRFKENSVGYEYINGNIIRIDTTFIHNEITKPAIKLLYEEEFEGASNEFLKAHKYYKEKDYKNAILYSGKAFESTMKTICEYKNYEYKKDSDTANKLINILCNNEFIPKELKFSFESSGLLPLRNKKGGHGQGESVIEVSECLAIHALNLCASNIVLLVKLYKQYK